MKKNRIVILFSLLLIPTIVGIYCLDLLGNFFFSDTPFAVSLMLYIFFVLIQHSGSTLAFGISSFFLTITWLFYVQTGVAQLTERSAEWFFVFFIFGLIQYMREAWVIDKKLDN